MERILMGGIVGFTFLTLVSYILIVLNIPFLIVPIVILCAIFVSKPLGRSIKDIKIKFNLQTIIVIAVFVLGIAGQMAVISPSGITQNGNLLFWSAHGHDGPWHIALMEEVKKGWPFENPIFAGEKLVNYHFFSDILPAMVSKYTGISNFNLYFRIFPFFYSLFLGASAYFLTKSLSKSKSAPIWATVFTYFAGSFGFIVTYLKGRTIGGESIFWATQPQSAGGNPPQIISGFIFLAAIYFYLNLNSQQNKSAKRILFVICVLLFGTLVSFKVYAGVVALVSLGVAGLWQLIKERKFETLILAFISGLLSVLLYFPNTSGSTSFLIFQPWWYVRTMIVEPSRLNLLDWELRRQTYIYEHNWKRVIFLEGVGFLILFFGNLGMRFLGLWELLKTHIFIKAAIVISIILPLLFLQKGVASNTSQFLQYFVLLFGILAGIQISKIPSKLRYILAPVVVILMLPTQIGLLNEFYSRPAFAKISQNEIVALDFIRENTPGDTVILTPPYNQYLDLKDTTQNVWDWFDTSYVSALSARRTYFDDYEQADIMGYNWRPRLETKKTVFENKDLTTVSEAFKETNANILYYPKSVKPIIEPSAYGLNLIFENEDVEVWKTN